MFWPRPRVSLRLRRPEEGRPGHDCQVCALTGERQAQYIDVALSAQRAVGAAADGDCFALHLPVDEIPDLSHIDTGSLAGVVAERDLERDVCSLTADDDGRRRWVERLDSCHPRPLI
jgi:hypothetical protein